ncbi:hypothetical protein BDD43_3975 [Mucilaginibacter gracilis]|uniref:Uncharacterized protein n=1 Tax=Mucilaginibacter gracilis TaxID=423350 RepID=A0A495J4X3_9SPHI|nr:hypothetical protein BDD43_3975 [Mucilaginibacter gracilis]
MLIKFKHTHKKQNMQNFGFFSQKMQKYERVVLGCVIDWRSEDTGIIAGVLGFGDYKYPNRLDRIINSD